MATHPGFHSLHEERAETLSVEGDLPEWLTGSLIRNGPGAFSFPDGTTVDHWFDGLAMLYRFTFDPGGRARGGEDAVHYRNRFLDTDTLAAARAGEFEGGFATGETTLRARLAGFLTDAYDNANIVVERVGDQYLALTESPRQVAVDPNTLARTGDVTYDGDAPAGQLAMAHMKRDPTTGAVVNVETEFGRTSQYHVHAVTGPGERRHVGSVDTDAPAYMHSFALTPHYVVLTEFPLRLNPLRLFRPGRQPPFIEQFEWEPERGTRIVVLDRTSGEVVADPVTDAVFGFHHVNAFERDGGSQVVFDLETVPDAESIDSLYLDSLRSGDLAAIAGRLERFTVDLDGERYGPGEATVEREQLYADGTALPTASPARWCREHRYVYAMSMDQPVTEWATGVMKYDTQRGTVTEYTDGGDYFGEPVFVPAPAATRGEEDSEARRASGSVEETSAGSRAEPGNSRAAESPGDDGVVLAVALDDDADRSRLVVLDGPTLEERARVTLPHAAPFDFHGRYFPELRAKG